MRNVFIIIRTLFLSFVGKLSKNKKSYNIYFGIFIIIIILALLIFSFTSNALGTMMALLNMEKNENIENAHHLAMFTSCAYAILVSLFLTIFRFVSPKKSSDNDLLLSLPIKRRHIIIARGIYNYLFDLIVFVIALMPNFIVYYVLAIDATFGLILKGLLLILVLPLLTNGIGGIISIFFSFIARKMRNYALFQTILIFIIIGLYLVANYWIQGYLLNINTSVENIKNQVPVIKIMLDYLLFSKWIPFIIFSIVSFLIFILSAQLNSKRLGKTDIGSNYRQLKNSYESNNIIVSLIKKELKHYFSIPIYILNTAFPGILYLGLSIAIGIMGYDKLSIIFNKLPFLAGIEQPFLLMIMLFLISSFIITGSSISLEGQRIWIIKTQPIKDSHIFASKIMANLCLTIPIIIICYPMMFRFIDYQYWWLYLILPILSSTFSAIMGLVINLMYPKLKWESEEVVVKQSLSALLSIFLPIIFVALPYILYLIVLYDLISFSLFGLIYIIYLIIISWLLIMWLKRKGSKALYKAVLTS